MNNFQDVNIILASNSPRRKELLKYIIPNFKTLTKDVDEIYPSDLESEKVPEFLAKLKASPFEKSLKDKEILITADTIVLSEKIIYGKPKNREEAIEILNILSNKKHQVITGVCIKTIQKEIVFSEMTYVTFKKLEEKEIEYYVDTFEPYDKAGAYAIQEWIGFIGVEKIDGDYNNIVGLPVQSLYTHLQKIV